MRASPNFQQVQTAFEETLMGEFPPKVLDKLRRGLIKSEGIKVDLPLPLLLRHLWREQWSSYRHSDRTNVILGEATTSHSPLSPKVKELGATEEGSNLFMAHQMEELFQKHKVPVPNDLVDYLRSYEDSPGRGPEQKA